MGLICQSLVWHEFGRLKYMKNSIFYRNLFFTGILSVFAFAKAYSQNTLTLKLDGIEEKGGTLYFSIFDSADGFPDNAEKTLQSKAIKEFGKTAQVTFDNLPDGTYAVTFYHDDNDNKELDKNFLGIPKEQVGASNMDGLGRPKFDKCKFELRGDKTMNIQFMN